MLTVKEVAQHLGVSPNCVYQLVATGRFACHRIGVGRGTIRISETDLAEFLYASRSASPSSAPAINTVPKRDGKFKHLRLQTKSQGGHDGRDEVEC